jgi:hypothetical protein
LTPVTFNTNTLQDTYAAQAAQKAGTQPGAASNDSAQASSVPPDTVQLSPAALGEVSLTGRVAGNQAAGYLTSEQGQQIYNHIVAIHSQIVADRQANGGAAPPSDPNATVAGTRQTLQAGRIALNEQAGNLTRTQAQQLASQLSATQQQIAAHEQANGGSLSPADAQAINQLQNQASQQIYQAAHPGSTTGQ